MMNSQEFERNFLTGQLQSKRERTGRAKGLGADESILSDEFATEGYLETKGIKKKNYEFMMLFISGDLI